MIAVAGHARLSAGERDAGGILARARWSLDSLTFISIEAEQVR